MLPVEPVGPTGSPDGPVGPVKPLPPELELPWYRSKEMICRYVHFYLIYILIVFIIKIKGKILSPQIMVIRLEQICKKPRKYYK